MNCIKCRGKGYIEDRIFRDNGQKSQLRQCCDIAAYSREVQRRALLLEDPEPTVQMPVVGKVLEFKRRTD